MSERMRKNLEKAAAFSAFILSFMFLFAVSSICAKPPQTVFGPYEITYNGTRFSFNGFERREVADFDGNTFAEMNITSGTYDNNAPMIVIDTSDFDFHIYDYPYMKFGYYSDSDIGKVDITITSPLGECWENNKPTPIANQYTELVEYLYGLTGSKNQLPERDTENVKVRIKPCGGGSKTLENDTVYRLRYIAFFKTKAEAEAYVYDGSDLYDDTILKNYDGSYLKLDSATLDTYLDGARTLAERILNSESIPASSISGSVYYVSPSGNDSADGRSPENAWRTLSKVNSFDFENGDGVLFERGGIWRRERLRLHNGVTYSAYGEGEKPAFYGSFDGSNPGLWRQTDVPYVYSFEIPISGSNDDVGNICFNGGEAWGIKISRTTDKTCVDNGFVDNGFETFYSGGGKFESYKDLKHNLEFWHSWDDNHVYLYCEYGNPGYFFDSVEISAKNSGIIYGSDPTDVIVDNIAVKYTGEHGVGISNAVNVTVQNCVFNWIGGSLQYSDGRVVRLGNAVQNWKNCDNFKILYCLADQIYDCCWTSQWQNSGYATDYDVIMNDFEFAYNVAARANSGNEVWLGDRVGTGYEMRISNMNLHDSYTLYGGYGWSHQRPNKDGNFFYGENVVNKYNKYENNSIHDNVNIFSTATGNICYYSGKNGLNFNHNTYIQAEDRYYGYNASGGGANSGTPSKLAYSRYSVAYLLSTGAEEGSTFYYTAPYGSFPRARHDGSPFPILPQVWDTDDADQSLSQNYYLLTARDLIGRMRSGNGKTSIAENVIGEDETEFVYIRSTGNFESDDNTYTDISFGSLGNTLTYSRFPYVKLGYKTNISSGSVIDINLFTEYDGTSKRLWGPTATYHPGERGEIVFRIGADTLTGGNDISGFDRTLIGSSAALEKLRLKFWGGNSANAMRTEDYFAIEYIAFLPSEEAVGSFTYNFGDYGNFTSDNYYLFTSRDLLGNLKAGNTKVKLDTVLTAEDGSEFLYVRSAGDDISNDNTYFDIRFDKLGFTPPYNQCIYAKLGYKTNITTSSMIDVNLFTEYNGASTRLWGPKPIISQNSDTISSVVFRISAEAIAGGSGISSTFDRELIGADATLDILRLKLWGGQLGYEMKADDYFAIEYIAFFVDDADANKFVYKFGDPSMADYRNNLYVDYTFICDYADLLKINEDPSGKYILSNDINLAGRLFSPLCPDGFYGIFDGNGHTLKGVDVRAFGEGDVSAGLFAENHGVIRNLNYIGTTLAQSQSGNAAAASLCAHNFGSIYGCNVTASVAAVAPAGASEAYEIAGGKAAYNCTGSNVLTKTLTGPPVKGDVNADGTVDSADVLTYMRYMLSGGTNAAGFFTPFADIDEDGRITSADMKGLARSIAGWKNYNL